MKLISDIVFTKNRPLQLEGYLESLYRHLPAEQIQTHILWKQELFTQEYEQLFSEFGDCQVVSERDFSSDFFDILNKIDTKYILFGIDDVVYYDSVDSDVIDETFNRFDDIFGFSLRFGSNVLNNGLDQTEAIETEEQKVHRINWPSGKTENTRYPFELCATIYRTELIKKIIDSSRSHNRLAVMLFSPDSVLIKGLRKVGLTRKARKVLRNLGFFYNPNTLESWVCRWCRENAANLPAYIYFQKVCASAVQVNLVNITRGRANYIEEDYAVESLNEKYQQGSRLDIDFIAQNKPPDTHCGGEHFKLIKR